MGSSELKTACMDLAWSLWTELGVPGVTRHHRRLVVDPEPLVVWSGQFIAAEPRLRDQVFAWCAGHAARLSASRLRGLISRATYTDVRGFAGLVAALRAKTSIRWSAPDAEPWPIVEEVPTPALDLGRASLLSFRLRALVGVGARADTLRRLLEAWPDGVTATIVAESGYSKRNIARILAELTEAGIVGQIRKGNRLEYWLRRAELLGRLVGAGDARHVGWQPLFAVLSALMKLESDVGRRSTAARRVAAHATREDIASYAEVVGLTSPPPTRGVRSAYDDLMGWAVMQASSLADGRSPALRGSGWGDGSY